MYTYTSMYILSHAYIDTNMYIHIWASQMAPVVKNLPANAGDVRDTDLISGLGRFPGGCHGNPLQCSCLENPVDRGAWWVIIHRVAKSLTCLKGLSTHAHTHIHMHMHTHHTHTCM